jgi:hypothetical protein
MVLVVVHANDAVASAVGFAGRVVSVTVGAGVGTVQM